MIIAAAQEAPDLPPDGVTLWRRIAQALGRQIAQGELAPGARLPTEAQLSARFGVNRHTVRRALDALSRDGLIRVEQGRGSFVAEDMLDYTVGRRTRFSEWVRKQNREPSGQVLRLDTVPAEPPVAAALEIEEGSPVVLLERLGLADAIPVSLGSHHFPAARLPGLAEALKEAAGISVALQRVGVADYQRRVTRVTARLPASEEAALLRMPRGRPLLVCENVNVDRAGRVVEFGISRYPTPRVQIVFEP